MPEPKTLARIRIDSAANLADLFRAVATIAQSLHLVHVCDADGRHLVGCDVLEVPQNGESAIDLRLHFRE